MTRVVRFHRLARDDVAEVALFLAATSAEVADRFLKSVEAGARRLASFPRVGRPVPPSVPFAEGVRAWPLTGFEKWILYYRSSTRGVEVLRVLHGSRDLSRLPPAEEE